MSVKISELPDASILDGTEYIAFVQGGQTVKARVVDLFRQPLYIKADGNNSAGFEDGDLTIAIEDNGQGENKATLSIGSATDTINE